MIKIATAGTALLATPLAALFGVVVVVAGAGSGSAAAAGQAAFNPSEEAIADIPAALITLYIEAAATCPGLPWQVLAGIGKVESNHGRYGGASIRADGQVAPPIIGIPLDGTNGTARARHSTAATNCDSKATGCACARHSACTECATRTR